MLRPGGVATIIGMVPEGVKIELDAGNFLRRGRAIQGCTMGSNRFRTDMPRYIEFYKQGRLKLDELVTQELALSEINKAFADMKAQSVRRSEESYLKEHFSSELRQVAASQGMEIHERDEQLIAHPSIVRVAPDRRAVRIDRKQVSAIRPTYLAALLRANQQKPARFNGGNFIEAIYNAYTMLTGGRSPLRRLEGGQSPAIPLARIYELLTVMPGASREYSRTDFARDLYRLDTNGPKTTRAGARLHFHSGRQSNIAFVAPDGHLITYHNVAFAEVNSG